MTFERSVSISNYFIFFYQLLIKRMRLHKIIYTASIFLFGINLSKKGLPFQYHFCLVAKNSKKLHLSKQI